jgi:hypothetical protein
MYTFPASKGKKFKFSILDGTKVPLIYVLDSGMKNAYLKTVKTLLVARGIQADPLLTPPRFTSN